MNKLGDNSAAAHPATGATDSPTCSSPNRCHSRACYPAPGGDGRKVSVWVSFSVPVSNFCSLARLPASVRPELRLHDTARQADAITGRADKVRARAGTPPKGVEKARRRKSPSTAPPRLNDMPRPTDPATAVVAVPPLPPPNTAPGHSVVKHVFLSLSLRVSCRRPYSSWAETI